MKTLRTLFHLCLALLACCATSPDGWAQGTAPLKVVLIFDINGRGDGGFNDSACSGLEKAAAAFGVKAVYVEPGRSLERDRVLQEAAASDAGMIIGVGFAFSDRLNELAPQYPHKKFACVDYSVRRDGQGRIVPPPANLAGLMFREEEGSYLVGAIAALTSRTGKIGFIGGMYSPIIRKFQAGYLAGAAAARPDIRIVSKFAGITGRAFNDPQKGYQIATRMYGEGADIVYHAAGATGMGLFRAAREMKRMAIGVDTDQGAQAPGLVLTSMTKHIDVAVFESVKAFVEGNFTGGLKTLGLKENGVGFVYNDQNRNRIGEEIHGRIEVLRTKIIAGELSVPVESPHKPLFSRTELQEILAELRQEIATALNRLDSDLQRTAHTVSGTGLEGDSVRGELKRLYGAHPYLIDCELANDRGIMLAVEPPAHRGSEGADLSGQAHWVRLFKTRKPVLSDGFRSVEGPSAVALHHPVFSADRRFSGSVSALFAPEQLLSIIVGPVSSNLPLDIFVMQPDGLMLYDIDADQIGRNTFHDPLYQPFPEVIALARKVAAAREGTGSYRFRQPGAGSPSTKIAYWGTVALHGTSWRVVIACAQDGIEP